MTIDLDELDEIAKRIVLTKSQAVEIAKHVPALTTRIRELEASQAKVREQTLREAAARMNRDAEKNRALAKRRLPAASRDRIRRDYNNNAVVYENAAKDILALIPTPAQEQSNG